MFTSDNKVKQWGIGIEENTSVFSPMFLFPVISMISYYIASLLEMAII